MLTRTTWNRSILITSTWILYLDEIILNTLTHSYQFSYDFHKILLQQKSVTFKYDICNLYLRLPASQYVCQQSQAQSDPHKQLKNFLEPAMFCHLAIKGQENWKRSKSFLRPAKTRGRKTPTHIQISYKKNKWPTTFSKMICSKLVNT